MAMNNVGTMMTPDMWIGLDKPSHYSPSIYYNPKVMKFTTVPRRSLKVNGKQLQYFAKMYFVVVLGDNAHAKYFFLRDRDFGWWKNVFVTALQVLHRLGFKRVYTVGCGFKTNTDRPYAHESNLTSDMVNFNQRTYNMAVRQWRDIMQHAADVHFEVISCTPDSALNDFVPYRDLQEAVAEEEAKIPAHDTVHVIHPLTKPPLPKATVLIPTFNRDELLKFGLRSISTQGLPDLEILVLNEGPDNEVTRGVAEKYGAKYVQTGSPDQQWRVPGFALNIGAKMATGDVLVLTCPEMWHVDDCLTKMLEAVATDPKVAAITNGKDDDGSYLTSLKTRKGDLRKIYPNLPPLRTELPFLMAVRKEVYLKIGGYDEDFTGRSYDDDDFLHRLKALGLDITKVDAHCVHLYHKRQTLKETKDHDRVAHNKKLFEERRGLVFRNQGREWGVLHAKVEV
jgi:GT2 family glycosyltransferase